MPNGTGLTGNNSAMQTVAAFPAPVRPASTSSPRPAPTARRPGSLSYCVVDMSLDGGLGDVTTKNVPLGDPQHGLRGLDRGPEC